jgi:hypothetical protein
MPKYSAAHEKKVDAAVRLLQTTSGVRVPQAMILAGFPKKDVANKILRQMVQCRYQQTLINAGAITNNVVIGDKSSFSDLTKNEDVIQLPTSPVSSSGSTNPKPKCKQIRLTSR